MSSTPSPGGAAEEAFRRAARAFSLPRPSGLVSSPARCLPAHAPMSTGWMPMAPLLLLAGLLTGCGGKPVPDANLTGAQNGNVLGADSEPGQPATKPANDPLLELANRLRVQREALEAQRSQRETLVIKRRGELARLTADLQRQIRRTGQTVEAVLAEFSKAAPTQAPLATIHADYLRAGQLENHVARLTKALDADAGLVHNLLRTEEKLRQDAEANAALDPAQREVAENLLAEAREHDPFAAGPDGMLKPEAVELQASLNVVASALKTRVAAMPNRPETSIDSLPAIPELKFETSGAVEATFLTAMQNDLAAGRAAAVKLFTEKQPEAAIERLYDSLDAVRARLESLKTRPAWSADCLKQLDEAAAALSEQLAGPYLTALEKGAKEAYLAAEEAARTAKWGHVMDLLEALVQLAPQATKIPDVFREIDEYLYSQERLESLEAAVARERFEAIRQMLTPGVRRREVRPVMIAPTNGKVNPTSLPAGVGGQLHGVSLAARHTAHKSLAEAGHRYLQLDAQVRQILLRFKPEADSVKTTERERTAALDDVRRLLAARDVEDSRVFVALEEKIAERRAARNHLTSAIGLREDASEVRQVEGQIAAIQQSQTAFQPGHDRAAGRGPTVDLLQFVTNPLNLLVNRTITINRVEFPFVAIPAAKFQMGDKAKVAVTLTSSYWMLKTEVTQAMYNAVVKERPWQGQHYVKDGGDYPAANVSPAEADAWCQKATAEARRQGVIEADASIRLPTEAQWEYAARAGTTTSYFFGEDACQLGRFAWYDDNAWNIGEQYAHQVGRKEPNPWGLLDISGNVWEWCADGYQSQSNLPGGTDPFVSPAGSSRVCRGGSFFNHASDCRVGFRGCNDAASCDIGFRVVLVE
jgi:formylglycine-generating enzyme required for sulfatase activity